jgi:hypothetical protein
MMTSDEIESLAESSPMFLPMLVVKHKPMFEVEFELRDIQPEFIDLLMWGQSPPPNIVLGED